MSSSRLLPALFMVLGCAVGCSQPATDDGFKAESSAERLDTIDNPIDTGLILVPGVWTPEAKLSPTASYPKVGPPEGGGFHLYHYSQKKAGLVSFQMQADPPPKRALVSYLKIINADGKYLKEQWASRGNDQTNLCEVILHVDAGKEYYVAATSQENSDAFNNGQRGNWPSNGKYSVQVLPLTDLKF